MLGATDNMEKVFYWVLSLRKKLWINANLEQLRTYHPSPNSTSTLTCYQLTAVGLREG